MKTQTKHTPGPWALFPHGIGTEIRHTRADGLSPAHACLYGSYKTSEADAALIAAAPDLLEALRNLQKAVTNAPNIRVGEFSTLVEDAIAAASPGLEGWARDIGAELAEDFRAEVKN